MPKGGTAISIQVDDTGKITHCTIISHGERREYELVRADNPDCNLTKGEYEFVSTEFKQNSTRSDKDLVDDLNQSLTKLVDITSIEIKGIKSGVNFDNIYKRQKASPNHKKDTGHNLQTGREDLMQIIDHNSTPARPLKYWEFYMCEVKDNVENIGSLKPSITPAFSDSNVFALSPELKRKLA